MLPFWYFHISYGSNFNNEIHCFEKSEALFISWNIFRKIFLRLKSMKKSIDNIAFTLKIYINTKFQNNHQYIYSSTLCYVIMITADQVKEIENHFKEFPFRIQLSKGWHNNHKILSSDRPVIKQNNRSKEEWYRKITSTSLIINYISKDQHLPKFQMLMSDFILSKFLQEKTR